MDYIMKTDEIVEIYTNRDDTTKFGVGFIRGISKDSILIENITPYGYYDGYTVTLIDEIYRTGVNTLYTHKIKKLWGRNGVTHKQVPQTNASHFVNLIEFAYANKKFISAQLLNSIYSNLDGVITCVTKKTIEICLVNNYGMPDGNSVILIDDITQLVCDSQDEIALEILYSSFQQ